MIDRCQAALNIGGARRVEEGMRTTRGGDATAARVNATPHDGDFTAYVRARGRDWERYAYALTGDPHQAQDVLQTVLLKMYRRWRRITEIEAPDAYVRRMVTHAYLDTRRARSATEVPVAVVPDTPSPEIDPAERVVDRDELAQALAVLSPHQRAVLVLRHLDGLDDETIAAVLGCSVGTVRSHASRGRERFRLRLSTDQGDRG